MKRWTCALALSFSLLSVAAYVSYAAADTAQKPEKGVVVGTAIEITTYAMKGLGEDIVQAHVSRTQQGFPVGILEEETGRVYVCSYRHPAPASGMTLANEMLEPYMGQKVAAQGLKYHAKGISVLRMSIVSDY